MAFENNIMIGTLVLTVNPEQYSPSFEKMGGFVRTVGGGLQEITISKDKLVAEIRGLDINQTYNLKRWAALRSIIDFSDDVPIAELEAQTRTVYEDLGSSSVDGHTVYLYVPTYRVRITNFGITYQGGVRNFNMVIQEV